MMLPLLILQLLEAAGSPAPSVPIAPGVAQPIVNLGGVTGAHASNWTAFLSMGG